MARWILHTAMMSDDPDKQNKSEKQRIIREQVKEGQTSHWDLDLLSREELEALMEARKQGKDAPASDGDEESEP